MSDHNYTRQYTDLRSCGPVRADLAHAHGARRSGTSHSLAHGTRPMVHKWPTQGSAHIVHIQRLCLVNHRPPSTAYSSGAVVCTEATKRQRIEASKRQRATKPQSGKVAKWHASPVASHTACARVALPVHCSHRSIGARRCCTALRSRAMLGGVWLAQAVGALPLCHFATLMLWRH